MLKMKIHCPVVTCLFVSFMWLCTKQSLFFIFQRDAISGQTMTWMHPRAICPVHHRSSYWDGLKRPEMQHANKDFIEISVSSFVLKIKMPKRRALLSWYIYPNTNSLLKVFHDAGYVFSTGCTGHLLSFCRQKWLLMSPKIKMQDFK